MNVLRKVKISTEEVKIGDQIEISLSGGLGDFTATAHKITDAGVLFVFDDYVTSRPMNERDTNEGGFEHSDLKKWMDDLLIKAFPAWLKGRISNLTLPTVGEFFGHEDKWNESYFESDSDKQLPLMKERKNRVAYFNNEIEWGWLRNSVKKDISSAAFASVYYGGYAGSYGASSSLGVRPEFLMIR